MNPLVQAIDALLAYVADHWRTPDYGDRLEQFEALDTSVYVEARRLGLQDADMPRQDATFHADEVVFFGRTNVPGCWSSPPDAATTLTLMATQGWKADMDTLRKLALQFEASALGSPGKSPILDAEGERTDNDFPWEDGDLDDLSPQTRRFLLYMLKRERADTDDLVDQVWGKSADNVSPGALSVAINRVNEFLGKHGYPRRLEKDERLRALGFTFHTQEGKARIYRHEKTGASVILPDAPFDEPVLLHHLAVIRHVANTLTRLGDAAGRRNDGAHKAGPALQCCGGERAMTFPCRGATGRRPLLSRAVACPPDGVAE